jgi:hypothetical protein
MLTKNFACLVLIAGGLYSAPGGALAQDAGVKPPVPLEKTIGQVTPTGPVPSLFVLNSAGAKLEGATLTMTGVAGNSIVFADRPVRAAGHVTTEQFIMQWDEGKDNFIKDPPNATISVLGGDGSKVEDAVVTLMKPTLDGGNLTFEVAVLEGSLSGGSGPAALFIDPGDYNYHYWHAPIYDGAWYRGAPATADPDLYYNPNSIDCSSPRAQAEGYC